MLLGPLKARGREFAKLNEKSTSGGNATKVSNSSIKAVLGPLSSS